jgi:hypothetical protein
LRKTIYDEACFTMKQVLCHLSLLQECDIDRLRKMLHSLTCTSSPNMNTWANCRSEVKTNKMPSSNFCGCTSGFHKSAHVLNKPIGSCYLKYAGTRGRFYYYICWLVRLWVEFSDFYVNHSLAGQTIKSHLGFHFTMYEKLQHLMLF